MRLAQWTLQFFIVSVFLLEKFAYLRLLIKQICFIRRENVCCVSVHLFNSLSKVSNWEPVMITRFGTLGSNLLLDTVMEMTSLVWTRDFNLCTHSLQSVTEYYIIPRLFYLGTWKDYYEALTCHGIGLLCWTDGWRAFSALVMFRSLSLAFRQ